VWGSGSWVPFLPFQEGPALEPPERFQAIGLKLGAPRPSGAPRLLAFLAFGLIRGVSLSGDPALSGHRGPSGDPPPQEIHPFRDPGFSRDPDPSGDPPPQGFALSGDPPQEIHPFRDPALSGDPDLSGDPPLRGSAPQGWKSTFSEIQPSQGIQNARSTKPLVQAFFGE